MRQTLFVAFNVPGLLLSAQTPPAAYQSDQVFRQVALMVCHRFVTSCAQ